MPSDVVDLLLGGGVLGTVGAALALIWRYRVAVAAVAEAVAYPDAQDPIKQVEASVAALRVIVETQGEALSRSDERMQALEVLLQAAKLDLARALTEVERRDGRIAELERQVTELEARIAGQDGLITRLRESNHALADRVGPAVAIADGLIDKTETTL